MEALAYASLLASAFTVAFSLPAGRILLVLSIGLAVADAVRRRRPVRLPPVVVWGSLFLLLTAWVTVHGVNPALGVPKLRKLVWFAAIPATAALVSSAPRLSALLKAFAAGGGVLAAGTCLLNPIRAWMSVRAGTTPDGTTALIDLGSMTDAQRLMIGVVISLGFVCAARRAGRSSAGWTCLLLLQAAALLLNFKRGSWVCAFALALVLLAVNTNWRYLLLLVALALVCLSIPPVRARLAAVAGEFRGRGGGRWVMWTQITPTLVCAHPWGIGYRSLTNDMMREIAPTVERDRDHLHSNIAQVLVETGWAGLALYILWMLQGVLDAGRSAWRLRAAAPARRVPGQLLLLLLVGLIANGLVEYNLGDAEIVLIYGLVMGAAAAAQRWTQPLQPS